MIMRVKYEVVEIYGIVYNDRTMFLCCTTAMTHFHRNCCGKLELQYCCFKVYAFNNNDVAAKHF